RKDPEHRGHEGHAQRDRPDRGNQQEETCTQGDDRDEACIRRWEPHQRKSKRDGSEDKDGDSEDLRVPSGTHHDTLGFLGPFSHVRLLPNVGERSGTGAQGPPVPRSARLASCARPGRLSIYARLAFEHYLKSAARPLPRPIPGFYHPSVLVETPSGMASHHC